MKDHVGDHAGDLEGSCQMSFHATLLVLWVFEGSQKKRIIKQAHKGYEIDIDNYEACIHGNSREVELMSGCHSQNFKIHMYRTLVPWYLVAINEVKHLWWESLYIGP